MERATGADTSYLHFEEPTVRAHTLKALILDTTRRGAPLTLDDVARALGPRLALQPRSRQRLLWPLVGHLGRPFWVDDPDFRLAAHLSERTVASPGDRAAFDDVCSALATEPLDLERPLWDAVLVHGLGDWDDLASGRHRQAVVLRVHHAVADGIASANMLRSFTSATPGGAPPPPADEWAPEPLPSTNELRLRSVLDAPQGGRALLQYGVEASSRWRRTADDRKMIASRDDLLGLNPAAPYGWTGVRFGAARSCASGQLDFDTLAHVKDHHGVSVNVVLLAMLGNGIRDEGIARGDDHGETEVATFSIATNTDAHRVHGNHLTPCFAKVHTDIADPGEQLRAIRSSTSAQIEALRRRVIDRSVRAADLVPRGVAVAARSAAYRTSKMNSTFVCANVPGPAETRWLGDCEIVDFVSWAVLIPPVGVNVTVYTYAGRLRVGVLTAPEVIDDPHRLVDRFATALDRLADGIG